MISARISGIEEVELSSEKNKYMLLIIEGDLGTDLLFALNIGNEYLDITLDGED